MPKIRKYNKKPISYDGLVSKLEERGLIIPDHPSAINYLQTISYYRLIGYGLSFEKLDDNNCRIGQYLPDTSFDTLIDVYGIDRKIRTLLLEAIEHIEVAVRSIINHEMSCRYDNAHWYLDSSLFKESEQFSHSTLIKEIKRHTAKTAVIGSDKEQRREVFIHHYYSQYDDPAYPPCWMIAEILPLGSWSKIYEYLSVSQDKKRISRQLDLPPASLQSWLHALTYLRNICAHQGRLFGKKFTLRPNQAKNIPLKDDNKLFNFVCITYFLLKKIAPESKWLDLLFDELSALELSLLKYYGFDEDWLEQSFWFDMEDASDT